MTGARKQIRPSIRQARIAELITKRGEASVGVLAKKFDTSNETIRRDLTLLSDAGQLRKVHGGARAIAVQGEGGFDARMRHQAPAKYQIAEKAAALVKSGQTLFMDTGSTTLICAERLAKIKHLTIITNSTLIAAAFAAGSGGADVYLLGGIYRGGNAQTVGAGTVSEIATYRADMALLTVGAIDSGGVMDFSNQEALVARAMIRASAEVVVLADHSKFDKRAAFKVSGLAGVAALVSDRKPNSALRAALRLANVDVV